MMATKRCTEGERVKKKQDEKSIDLITKEQRNKISSFKYYLQSNRNKKFTNHTNKM